MARMTGFSLAASYLIGAAALLLFTTGKTPASSLFSVMISEVKPLVCWAITAFIKIKYAATNVSTYLFFLNFNIRFIFIQFIIHSTEVCSVEPDPIHIY